MDSTAYDHHSLARHLEHLHDACVVWTPEAEGEAAAVDGLDELADHTAGVPILSIAEPHRFGDVHGHATQDYTGMHHAHRLHGDRVPALRRATIVEHHRLVSLHYRCGLFRV